jgi:hypothetical protein
MKIPFSIDEFLSVFEHYNNGVWPLQIFIHLLAITGIVILFTQASYKNRIISLILSALWLWMGIVYHLIYFSPINPAANVFGVMFIVQGLIFAYFGFLRKEFEFEFRLNAVNILAIIFLSYALIGYPILSHQFGHVYPRTPTFGLPCPTTIYTFGILLLVNYRIPVYILIIPFLWSLIGFSAAVNLEIREDYTLVVAGILSSVLLIFGKPRRPGYRGYKGYRDIGL